MNRSSARRSRLLSLIGLLALLVVPSITLAADEPLRIAFIAYQNPDQLLDDIGPVTDYLERELGRPVESFAATDYAGVVEALRNEMADVGFMGPLQYVIAREQAGAEPLLGEVYSGSATYVSKIFVRKDSGITSLAQLKDKTIAFVDPISSSGYLYPLDTFKSAGLISDRGDADDFFRKIYFAGGDEQALRAVLNEFVDAVGVGQFAFNLLRGNERNEVVAIGESRAIPSHGVFVRSGLGADVAKKLKDALLALNDSDEGGLLKKLYNVDGYVEATPATYDGVTKLAREYGFIE